MCYVCAWLMLVSASTSGFFDEAGKERGPYCCYLSTTEWREAKRRTLADITGQVVGKVEGRKASESADATKLDALIARIQTSPRKRIARSQWPGLLALVGQSNAFSHVAERRFRFMGNQLTNLYSQNYILLCEPYSA